jgi:formate dehydrogenase subunit gamma
MSRAKRINEICQEYHRLQGPLLPILHAVQAEMGCVDAQAEREIANALNLSRAEVHGVVSFYHDFTSEPDPRPTIQLCRAEACKARGIDAILPAAEQEAGGRVRLETVYCLGLCSVGPSARVGNEMHARLDEASLVELVKTV